MGALGRYDINSEDLLEALRTNRERRARLAEDAAAAELELRELIPRGYSARLDVAAMASQAGISRDKAHRILKEAGLVPWRQKQKWAAEVLKHIPRGGYEQNLYRAMVNMILLNALGARPDEDVQQSIDGVLEAAVQSMKDNGHPNFVPTYTDEAVLRALAWPA
jgi:hypothetical protein